MLREERAEYIYRRAYELAASGLHLEPITIVAALIREGYSEADIVLGNPLIRADLRQVCTRNWPGTTIVIDGQEVTVIPASEQDNSLQEPVLKKPRKPKY